MNTNHKDDRRRQVVGGVFLDESGVVTDSTKVLLGTAIAYPDNKAGLVLASFFGVGEKLSHEMMFKRGEPYRSHENLAALRLLRTAIFSVRAGVKPHMVYFTKWADKIAVLIEDPESEEPVDIYALSEYTVLEPEQQVGMVCSNVPEVRAAQRLNEWAGRVLVEPVVVESEIQEKIDQKAQEASQEASGGNQPKPEQKARKEAPRGKGRPFGPQIGTAEVNIKFKTGKTIRLTLAELGELKKMI